MKNQSIVEVSLDSITPDPDQPRTEWQERQEHIRKLAESYAEHGLIEPIEIDENNIIILGECRWRAAKKAGLKKVKVRRAPRRLSKAARLERQLVDDSHRQELTPIEFSWGLITALLNTSNPNTEWTISNVKETWKRKPSKIVSALGSERRRHVRTLGKKLGLSATTVERYLAFFDFNKELPSEAEKAYSEGKLGPLDLHDIRRISNKPEIQSKIIKSVLKKKDETGISMVKPSIRRRVDTIKRIEDKADPVVLEAVAEGKIEPETAERVVERAKNEIDQKRIILEEIASKNFIAAKREAEIDMLDKEHRGEFVLSENQEIKLREAIEAANAEQAKIESDPEYRERLRWIRNRDALEDLLDVLESLFCPKCGEPASSNLRFKCHSQMTLKGAYNEAQKHLRRR